MNILYFSPIYWDDLKQRPQYIAEGLSTEHKVWFIEPSISFINGYIRGNTNYNRREVEINDNLIIIRPSGKWRLPRSLDLFDIFHLNFLYEKLQLSEYIKKSDLVWLGSPVFYPLVKNINKPIIYDKMDDYAFLTKNYLLKMLIKIYEHNLINCAETVIISSKTFYEQVSTQNNNVYLVNNAIDDRLLNKEYHNEVTQCIELLKKQNKLIFGYIGTVDHWFDYDAITTILEFRPDFHVVIVGRDNIRYKRLKHDNIHYFDPIDKSHVYSVVNCFDYCLYPFKINDFLNTINPVKLYEYLGCNKKVIAASSLETQAFTGLLALYSDNESLRELLKKVESIQKPFTQDKDVRQFLNENSWNSRVDIIKDIIRSLLIQFRQLR